MPIDKTNLLPRLLKQVDVVRVLWRQLHVRLNGTPVVACINT